MKNLAGQPTSKVLELAVLSSLHRGQLVDARRLAQAGIADLSAERSELWALQFVLVEVLRMEGRLCEALEYVVSLDSAEDHDEELVARRKMHTGYVLALLGRHQEASALLSAALRTAINLDHLILLCDIKARIAMLEFLSKDLVKAYFTYREILQEEPSTIGWYLRCVGLNGAGKILLHSKRYEEAIEHLEESVKIARQEVAALIIAGCQSEIALCRLATGNSNNALTLLRESERITLQLGALHMHGIVLGDIGNVYLAEGDYWTAIPYYQRALNLALAMKDPAKADNWSNNIRLAYSRLRSCVYAGV